MIHELQKESALRVGYLTGTGRHAMKLNVQQAHERIARIHDPARPEPADGDPVEGNRPFDGLNILRNRVLDRADRCSWP